MVVVPPLAHGEEGEEPVVAAVVMGSVAPLAKNVGDRIDREDRVPEDDRRPTHTDRPTATARDEVAGDGEDSGRYPVVLIEPAELRIPQEVWHQAKVGGGIFAARNPPHVGLPEPMLYGRMHVLRFIGILVVMTVLRRPPDRPFLQHGSAEKRDEKLHEARSSETPVREVPMVPRGDHEHTGPIQHEPEEERPPMTPL